MNEIEHRLDLELSGREPNTFLYQLAENRVWNTPEYERFQTACSALLADYKRRGKTADANELLKLLTDRLIYIAMLVQCHYSSVDFYRIENWDEQMESEWIPEFFETFRELSAKIFSL